MNCESASSTNGGLAEAEMKKLLDDYGIKADASDEWRTQNMNRFAQFIGERMTRSERTTLTDEPGVRGQMDLK